MTTLDVSPKEVLKTYRPRNAAKRGFRITKETIKIRSICNRTEQYIKAHLFVCFLTYLLCLLLEMEVRREIHGITGTKALNRLKRFAKNVSRTAFSPTKEDVTLLAGPRSR